jgi:hypothetical protein
VHGLIAMFRVSEDFRGMRRRQVGFQNFLIIITLRISQPDFYLLCTRDLWTSAAYVRSKVLSSSDALRAGCPSMSEVEDIIATSIVQICRIFIAFPLAAP